MANLKEKYGTVTFPETCLTPEVNEMYWFLFYIALVSKEIHL